MAVPEPDQLGKNIVIVSLMCNSLSYSKEYHSTTSVAPGLMLLKDKLSLRIFPSMKKSVDSTFFSDNPFIVHCDKSNIWLAANAEASLFDKGVRNPATINVHAVSRTKGRALVVRINTLLHILEGGCAKRGVYASLS